MEITKEIFETVLEVFKEQAEKELTYKKLNNLLNTQAQIELQCDIGNKIKFKLQIQANGGEGEAVK